MKRVAWPPVAPTISETNDDNNEFLMNNNYNNVNQPSANKVAPRVPPKPALRQPRDQVFNQRWSY